MNFSQRTLWNLEENAHAAALREARARDPHLLDLTVSNPTACGFDYPAHWLQPLAAPAALDYTPEPLGLLSARAAVATYCRDHAADLSPTRICLTASTSEAYSYLFRLLCDPGDEVLAARPSYPLFDFIARLDDVHLRDYPLLHDPNSNVPNSTAHDPAAWSIDLHALEAAITPRTRAILLVHPNNPTGNFVSPAERTALEELCARHGLALIVDEVFLDYALGPIPPRSFAAPLASSSPSAPPCLTFVLSGLSKLCGLPQMKLSWLCALGPAPLVENALARLEVIADTFLSVSAPVQHAAPTWLAERSLFQRQVLDRMRANLAALDQRLRGSSAHRLACAGGWTAVLRVPRTVAGTDFTTAALARGVVVQPGSFYGLPEARIVLSLLTPPGAWTHGLARLPLD